MTEPTAEDRIELGIQQGMADARHDIEAPLRERLADQQARHEVELRALQSQIAELERDRDRLRGLLRAPGLYPPTYETDRKPTL